MKFIGPAVGDFQVGSFSRMFKSAFSLSANLICPGHSISAMSICTLYIRLLESLSFVIIHAKPHGLKPTVPREVYAGLRS